MNQEKSLQIKLELKGEHLKNFTSIHEKLGNRYQSDTIRHCINATHDYHHQSRDNIEIDPAILDEIQKLLRLPSVQNKLLLSTTNKFVSKALELLIENIRKDGREIGNTIWHWEFLSNIPEEDRDVLITLVKCQKQNESNMVGVQQIARQLNRRNVRQIQLILEKYVSMGMLEQASGADTILYHAPSTDDLLEYDLSL